MEEFVQNVCHSIQGGFLSLNGRDVDIEEETRLDMIRVNHVVKFVEFLLEEMEPVLHDPALDRIPIPVHMLEFGSHHDEPFLCLVLLEEVCAVHLLDLCFGGFHERYLIPALVDILIQGIACLRLDFLAHLVLVDCGEVREVRDAFHEFGVFVDHLEDVPQMLYLDLERGDLDIVGFPRFDELRIVVVFQFDLVAFVGKDVDVRILVFTDEQLTRVLEVFNVLVPPFWRYRESRLWS